MNLLEWDMTFNAFNHLVTRFITFSGQAQQGFYFIEKDDSGLLRQKFYQLVGEEKAVPQVVEVVMGRTLQVGS